MTPELLLRFAIDPALELLPKAMRSNDARAQLLATALQESRCKDRCQLQGGPARGYWQMEKTGGAITGVPRHPATKDLARDFCHALDYDDLSPDALYIAVEHNAILAAGLARLLYWTLSGPLPREGEPQAGWDYYIAAWRPGKRHRQTWDAYFAQAWRLVR